MSPRAPQGDGGMPRGSRSGEGERHSPEKAHILVTACTRYRRVTPDACMPVREALQEDLGQKEEVRGIKDTVPGP